MAHTSSATEPVLYPRLPGRDLGVVRWARGAPGLGNLLFPWARCVAAAEDFGLPIIWPTWPQITLGPLVRREPPRFYTDLFVPAPRYIRGLTKQKMLRSCDRLDEKDLSRSSSRMAGNVFEFSGLEKLFAPILPHHNLIKTHLIEITRARHLPPPASAVSPHIGVHVRLGDFSLPRDARDLDIRNGRVNFRIPIQWYVHIVKTLRQALGEHLGVKMFSDGSDEELAPLLSLPGVTRVRGQSPLSDILTLAQSTVLVTSGSTFSMWASYLGRMPVVWHPGQMRLRMYGEDNRDAECEVDTGAAAPAAWLDLAAAALARAGASREPSITPSAAGVFKK